MHNLTKIKIFRALLYITYPISLIFIFPFAALKRKNKSPLFFFFDRYAIGGAQKIHIDILNSIPETYKQLYFTRLSKNKSLQEVFFSFPNTDARDIHFWCDNLIFRLFTVHYYAFYINRHKKAHVFSSNSTFFYDILPFINRRVTRTELLHNFTHGKNGMEFFGLANVDYLDYRIVYDNYTLSNIKKQYIDYRIPAARLERILFIEPGVTIPGSYNKTYQLPLRILYAGRGGPQKRLHLLNRIAEICIQNGLPVEFHFAGSLDGELSETVMSKSVMHGEVKEAAQMDEIYKTAHVILMTSAYEGFPMLIKEGMAHGCVPVVTALEGNKTHLTHLENALLIDAVEDEEKVVAEGYACVAKLAQDKALYEQLSQRAYAYAVSFFDRDKFTKTYHTFLVGNN